MPQKYTLSSSRGNTISNDGIMREYFDTFSPKSGLEPTFVNNYNQGCSINFPCCSFTGKERDEETGYGYFGARYMDHELMTMWLSVDPMADKYPSLSPYNYCAWNPIKVVDPNGMDTLIFSLDHSKKRADYKETRPGGDNVGIIKGGKDNTICEFTFADERWCDRFVACDDEDIVDMNLGRDRDHYLYNSIVFIDDKKIESILKEGGLNFADLRSQSLKNKIGYAKEQSRGTDATLDFVNYKGVQEISPYKLILTGSQGNYLAHDKFNFGNFLWGMAMRRMGMPRWLVLAGSHWDCYRTTKRLDSFDDQRSLWFGYNKAIK